VTRLTCCAAFTFFCSTSPTGASTQRPCGRYSRRSAASRCASAQARTTCGPSALDNSTRVSRAHLQCARSLTQQYARASARLIGCTAPRAASRRLSTLRARTCSSTRHTSSPRRMSRTPSTQFGANTCSRPRSSIPHSCPSPRCFTVRRTTSCSPTTPLRKPSRLMRASHKASRSRRSCTRLRSRQQSTRRSCCIPQ